MEEGQNQVDAVGTTKGFVDEEIDLNMIKVRERKRILEEKIRQFESKMGQFGL